MKKTAVEWLEEQVKSKEWQDMFIFHKEEVFDQAKEMEKEQINEAFYDGYYKEELYDSRKYYNETFKQK